MTKQTFIQGTMILLAAGVINRILGFVPRIMLPRFIGAEGVGLYQMGYPFLIVLITIITGGIPLAIAKLVAEAEAERNMQRVRNILFVSLCLTCSVSLIFTIFCVSSARWITSHLLTDSRVYYTFLAMSPIILIVSVSAVFRGYFQGRHNMVPTASSQVVETLVRCVTVLAFAYLLLPFGVEFAAAGAMAGVMAGELIGLFVLFYHYQKKDPWTHSIPLSSKWENRISETMTTLRHILRISIPVTASKLVGSGSYFLESIMIVQSLAVAGITVQMATAQYGALTGMVIPILLLPGALTYSLSISLVPSLSEAAAKKEMHVIHKRLGQSLKLALVAGAPFVMMMIVLAEPLTFYLYGDSHIADMLKMMAPAALFIYFQGPLQAALQALDRPGTALLNTFIGASIKLTLIYLLAAKAQMGIYGAVLAIMINMILVTLLHWNSVVRLLQFSLPVSDFLKAGCSMMLMGGALYLFMHGPWIPSPFLRFIIACASGSILYLICIIRFRLVDKDDVQRLPWIGHRIARWISP